MKMHLSLDDFFQPLMELTDDRPASVFDQPEFAFLKKLHEEYGAVISCYCFLEDETGSRSLCEVPDCYREEFAANGDWLRFGFHARNKKVNYGSTLFHTEDTCDDYEQAKADYEHVIRELGRITGGGRCLDRMPRIHFYSGTETDCRAWMEAQCGVLGLLSAEDQRLCYYHTEDQRRKLIQEGILREEKLGLTFCRTDLRLESEKDLEASIQTCVEQKQCREKGQNELLVLFTHATLMKKEEILEKMRFCCKFARENEFVFAFPEELL